jgi:hypothetical protein
MPHDTELHLVNPDQLNNDTTFPNVTDNPNICSGTGKTMPFVCTDNPFYIGQIVNDIRTGNESDTALRRLWERGKVDGNICRKFGNGNETAELIGTAFTARDMMSVVDALEEDGMLRYWGEPGSSECPKLATLTVFARIFLRHNIRGHLSGHVP